MRNVFDEFVRLNREAAVGREATSGYVLVDAAYQDRYIVTAALKVAQCVAQATAKALVVITAPSLSRETDRLIDSFNPARRIAIRDLAAAGARRRLATILRKVAQTDADRLVSLEYDDVAVGEHLYDTMLMRFALPSLERLTPRLRLHLIAELCILEGLRSVIDTDPPALAVLPDNVYRAGAFFGMLASRRVPMIAGLDLNEFTAHYYPANGRYLEHCRTPDRSIVDRVVADPALMREAEAYIQHRISGNQTQHDVRRAYRDDAASVDRSRLCELMRFAGSKPVVMVAAHVFCDAPHACEGLIFKDYKQWLIETCRLLKANPAVDFFVKEHPSTELYGEQGLTRRIAEEAGALANVLPVAVNTRSLFSSIDAVITCGGTAGSEFPCFGVPVLLAAGAPYDQLNYVKRATTRKEYENEIARLHTYGKLASSDIERAKAALFTMQVVTRLPKADLGLGAQPFMRGSPMDETAFLQDATDDLRTRSGYARLTAALTELMDGRYRNIVDPRWFAAAGDRASSTLHTVS